MSVSDKKKSRSHDQKRENILLAAREILQSEGMEGISVRKITQKIGYTPAIIYHYFEDKDAILLEISREGLESLMLAVRKGMETGTPEEMLQAVFSNYIHAALGMPEIYRHIMCSQHPEVLKITRVLFPGISHERSSFQILVRLITEISAGKHAGANAELLAQVLWSASFGLILRLITENPRDTSYKEALISAHLQSLPAIIKSSR